MTARELLELSEKKTKGYLGIPEMDSEEAKRLMNIPSAIFIRRCNKLETETEGSKHNK